MTLIQATKIIGLKVITLDGGKEIDTIKDVIYDPEENRVKALLIDKDGWFKDAMILSIEKIESIGQNAVIVKNEEVFERASENSERVANIAHDKNYLTKTKIVTVGGDDLGTITDLYFSLPYGNVQEFEVSGGLISDLQSGRNTISVSDIVTIGQDVTIVKSFTQSKLDEQNKTQGAQGVATNAAGIAGMIGGKAKEAWEIAKTKAGEAKEYVDSGKLKSDTDNLVENVKTKAQEIKEDLAPKVEDAKENIGGMVSGMSKKVQDMGSDLKEKGEEVKENLEPKIENMKNEAQDLGSDLKAKGDEFVSDTEDFIDDKTDQITNKVNDSLKSQAVGQYLKIDILSEEGGLIASIGEEVTEEILDMAQENGQLNELLANLSKEPVKI